MKYSKALVLVMTLFFTKSSGAQRMVQSGTYNVMLKALLSHSVTEISATKAYKMKDVVFLDAREKTEYNVSHIKEATWIGYDDFDIERVANLPTDKKVIVYCSVGKRSENISEKLEAAGYKDVSNLYGGIFEWVNNGYDVYDSSGKTNKVHAYSSTWGIWLNKGEKVYE